MKIHDPYCLFIHGTTNNRDMTPIVDLGMGQQTIDTWDP